MSRANPVPPSSGSGPARQVLRVLVVAAFAATLWFAGPRAWRIVEARLGAGASPAAAAQRTQAAAQGPSVATDKLAALEVPDWLRGDLLRAVLADFEPRLRGTVALMDETAASQLQARLRASPFVTGATLERRFPDRFRLRVALRRPVARWVEAGRTAVLFDADGVALSPGDASCDELPQIALDGAAPLDVAALRAGAVADDRRIVAACAVAAEWRDAVVASFPEAPRLRAIDPRNLGYAFVADPRHAQVLVGLESADGNIAWFQHGLAALHGGAIDAATRADVLRKVVELRPGLVGVESGDLRLSNTWRNSLVPGDDAARR